jgi:hypothetical protein
MDLVVVYVPRCVQNGSDLRELKRKLMRKFSGCHSLGINMAASMMCGYLKAGIKTMACPDCDMEGPVYKSVRFIKIASMFTSLGGGSVCVVTPVRSQQSARSICSGSLTQIMVTGCVYVIAGVRL